MGSTVLKKTLLMHLNVKSCQAFGNLYVDSWDLIYIWMLPSVLILAKNKCSVDNVSWYFGILLEVIG